MLDAALIERALEKTGKSKGGLARAMGVRAGADVLVAGSAVFKGGSVLNPAPYGDNINAIRAALI